MDKDSVMRKRMDELLSSQKRNDMKSIEEILQNRPLLLIEPVLQDDCMVLLESVHDDRRIVLTRFANDQFGINCEIYGVSAYANGRLVAAYDCSIVKSAGKLGVFGDKSIFDMFGQYAFQVEPTKLAKEFAPGNANYRR